jgi:hypothetical protein
VLEQGSLHLGIPIQSSGVQQRKRTQELLTIHDPTRFKLTN